MLEGQEWAVTRVVVTRQLRDNYSAKRKHWNDGQQLGRVVVGIASVWNVLQNSEGCYKQPRETQGTELKDWGFRPSIRVVQGARRSRFLAKWPWGTAIQFADLEPAQRADVPKEGLELDRRTRLLATGYSSGEYWAVVERLDVVVALGDMAIYKATNYSWLVSRCPSCNVVDCPCCRCLNGTYGTVKEKKRWHDGQRNRRGSVLLALVVSKHPSSIFARPPTNDRTGEELHIARVSSRELVRWKGLLPARFSGQEGLYW